MLIGTPALLGGQQTLALRQDAHWQSCMLIGNGVIYPQEKQSA